jgi:hypothetical protein
MTPALHGKPLTQDAGGYESPDDYADQGDTRVIRDLQFNYLAVSKDGAGNNVFSPVDLPRNTVVTVDQMGLLALQKGEGNHSFYTTAELEQRERALSGAPAASGEADVSSMGAHELAEYINGANSGEKKLTVDETLALVPDGDKDFANRLLEAENIATEGDPRTGVEVGLTAIIEGANQ